MMHPNHILACTGCSFFHSGQPLEFRAARIGWLVIRMRVPRLPDHHDHGMWIIYDYMQVIKNQSTMKHNANFKGKQTAMNKNYSYSLNGCNRCIQQNGSTSILIVTCSS